MKQKVKGLEFVRFTRENLGDFREYILPHIYEELLRTESFEENHIVAAAALIRGVPAAAVIARLLEEEEIFLFSIAVAENYRRLGIGTELIECLLQTGEETYLPRWGVRSNSTRVFLHCEYALSGEDRTGFEAFLRAAGFTEFEERGSAWLFRLADLQDLAEPAQDAHCFSDIGQVTEEQLEDFYLRSGITPAVPLSFYSGSDDSPEFVFLMQREGENLYSLSSNHVFGENCLENYKKVLACCVNAALRENPGGSLLVNGDYNLYGEFWSELAGKTGEEYLHSEAGMYVLFEDAADRTDADRLLARLRKETERG